MPLKSNWEGALEEEGAVLEGQAKGEGTKGHFWCVTACCCAIVLWGGAGEFL